MNATNDFDRMVSTWLETDGPSEIPSELVDGALGSARTTGQRHGLRAAIAGSGNWPAGSRVILFPAIQLRLVLVGLLVLAITAAGLMVAGAFLERPTDLRSRSQIMVFTDSIGVHVLSPDGSSDRAVAANRAEYCPRLVNGGRDVMYSIRFGPIVLVPLDGSQSVQLPRISNYGHADGSRSPDGSAMAFTTTGPDDSRELRVESMVDGKVSMLLRSETEELMGHVWSPNGTLIAVARGLRDQTPAVGQMMIDLVDLTGTVQRSLGPLPSGDSVFISGWSPDGSHLAYVSYGRGLVVVDAKTGAFELLDDQEILNTYLPPSWSYDGRWLAVVTGGGKLIIASSNGTERRTIALGQNPAQIWTPAQWSPTDDILAIADGDRVVTMRSDGSDRRDRDVTARGDGNPVATAPWDFAWAPDGSAIAVVSVSGHEVAVRAWAPNLAADPVPLATYEAPLSSEPRLCISWEAAPVSAPEPT